MHFVKTHCGWISSPTTPRYFGRLLVCVALFWGINTGVKAQSIPIACDQYIQALKACTKNAIDFYGRTNVNAASNLKNQLKELKELESMIRKGVATQGEDVIAERCTNKQNIKELFQQLNNLVTVLAYSQRINEDCQTKYFQIQLPMN